MTHITHITTDDTSDSTVTVVGVHRSLRGARLANRRVLEVDYRRDGCRAPRRGDRLGIVEERSGSQYALAPQ